jgi:hypothetical protein
LTLATVAAKDRNEVDAALEAFGLIDLKGKIVTADALRCNRRTVEAIIEKGGDSRTSRATDSFSTLWVALQAAALRFAELSAICVNGSSVCFSCSRFCSSRLTAFPWPSCFAQPMRVP